MLFFDLAKVRKKSNQILLQNGGIIKRQKDSYNVYGLLTLFNKQTKIKRNDDWQFKIY